MTITILPPEADPLATLRTMAAFGMDEGRGIAEIRDGGKPVMAGKVYQCIGLAILCKNPEKAAIPIYDPKTRAVEIILLADWLKARGYEASACRWNRKGSTMTGWRSRDDHIAWELITGPAEVPALPPEMPKGGSLGSQLLQEPPQQALAKQLLQALWRK